RAYARGHGTGGLAHDTTATLVATRTGIDPTIHPPGPARVSSPAGARGRRRHGGRDTARPAVAGVAAGHDATPSRHPRHRSARPVSRARRVGRAVARRGAAAGAR